MRRLIALISSLFKLVFLGSFLVVVCASIILGVYGILAKEYDLKQLEHITSKTIPNDHQIIDFLKKQDPDSGYVSLDQVSSEFVEALIVREDTRFYSHKGIDPIGIIRASYRNIIKNKREDFIEKLCQDIEEGKNVNWKTFKSLKAFHSQTTSLDAFDMVNFCNLFTCTYHKRMEWQENSCFRISRLLCNLDLLFRSKFPRKRFT